MTKARTVQQMTDKERQAVLAQVRKEIEAIERRHGEAVTRWAFNKVTAERADRRRLTKKKKELEAQLDALGV